MKRISDFFCRIFLLTIIDFIIYVATAKTIGKNWKKPIKPKWIITKHSNINCVAVLITTKMKNKEMKNKNKIKLVFRCQIWPFQHFFDDYNHYDSDERIQMANFSRKKYVRFLLTRYRFRLSFIRFPICTTKASFSTLGIMKKAKTKKTWLFCVNDYHSVGVLCIYLLL